MTLPRQYRKTIAGERNEIIVIVRPYAICSLFETFNGVQLYNDADDRNNNSSNYRVVDGSYLARFLGIDRAGVYRVQRRVGRSMYGESENAYAFRVI